MRESDFSTLEWMRAARGYEVKIVSRDGAVTKFAGFKESVSGYDIYNVRYVIDKALGSIPSCGNFLYI